jgi:transposase
MARAYGEDLRGRVVAAAAGGVSARTAAARFGVAIATAVRWVARARDGERGARRQGRPRGSRLDAHEAFVAAMIEAKKDISLDEMVQRLMAERDVRLGRSVLSVWLRRRGWTFKKRPHTHWSRSERMS